MAGAYLFVTWPVNEIQEPNLIIPNYQSSCQTSDNSLCIKQYNSHLSHLTGISACGEKCIREMNRPVITSVQWHVYVLGHCAVHSTCQKAVRIAKSSRVNSYRDNEVCYDGDPVCDVYWLFSVTSKHSDKWKVKV
jgi:hypothetical protein